MVKQNELLAAIQLFPREDNSISIWDHPNFKSSIVLPDNYSPITRTEQGLELMNRMRLNEEQITVLKVVGDAICANEDQLRRYLTKKYSPSITSRHLKYLGRFGLVERHKCRLAFIEEDGKEKIRPPGPHTLGIGGYKLLNHLYGESTFTPPDLWQQNSMAVQRYVSMNEIRCTAIESGNIRAWSWYPYVGGMSKYKKPFAVTRIEMGEGEVQMLIDRAQMSQNFLGYFRARLEEYRFLYERDKKIIVDGFNSNPLQQIIVLSVSSVGMANYLQEQMKLHTYPFDVWFLVDEWIDQTKGLEGAFAQVSKAGLHRIKVNILRKQ